jgi:hypothetical protein
MAIIDGKVRHTGPAIGAPAAAAAAAKLLAGVLADEIVHRERTMRRGEGAVESWRMMSHTARTIAGAAHISSLHCSCAGCVKPSTAHVMRSTLQAQGMKLLDALAA